MMDWINTNSKLPELEKGCKNITVEVEVITFKGEQTKAFCYRTDNTWYRSDNKMQIYEGVMKWRYCN